jgi:hypothetical protein
MADTPNKSEHAGGTSPWSAPVSVESIPETGRHIELAADAAIMAAIAKFANVNAVSGLHATFDLTRRGRNGLRVTGEVRARVAQTCVVSLEPMETEIAEAVDVTYEPPKPEAVAPARAKDHAKDEDSEAVEVSFSDDEEDPPEPLVDGIADLGALATEFLILGIDPYPRKPDAAFEAPEADTGESGPFAALAKLKREDDGGK